MSTYQYFYSKIGALQPKTGIYHRPGNVVARAKRTREEFEQGAVITIINNEADSGSNSSVTTIINDEAEPGSNSSVTPIINDEACSNSSVTTIINDEATREQLRSEIYEHLLLIKRVSRYCKLMEQFTGAIEDVEAVRAYLPEKYKEFAGDQKLLEIRLLSESKLKLQTQIWGIIAITNCYGCQYDRPGQRDHMDCMGGCLHDPSMCLQCG